MEMVDILCDFIKAERTGNWLLHLSVVRSMLPFLASSGHHLYIKSAYLYLQIMSKLPETNSRVHQYFLNGYHVAQRSDRFWGGLSTDLVIEQVLMRSLKTSGGLTRGRGMTELQQIIWLLSTPACAEVNLSMQELTGIRFVTSEQHKESSQTRMTRDYKDASVLAEFLVSRNPFTADDFINIVTGESASINVNVDRAKEIGEQILSGMSGKQISEYSSKICFLAA